jgi:polyhydroxyalkanoate synthesis repressor PhaR
LFLLPEEKEIFMPVIKRYPNRKLYDTQAKRYITLDGIADLIREGEDIQVIDHASGEDLTALTLTQIIFEQEKKQTGVLPLSMLTGLIRASGDRLTSLPKVIFSNTFWQQIDEEIKSRIQTLVKLGEMEEEEGKNIQAKLLQPKVHTHGMSTEKRQPTAISSQELEAYLLKRQVPTQADINQLYSQLEALANKLDKITESDHS